MDEKKTIQDEKKIIRDEEAKHICDSDVSLDREEENKGIGYEIGFGSTTR